MENDASLRLITAEKRHFDDIMNFLLEHFCFSEPTNVAVNLTQDEARTFWPDIVNHSLAHPVSVIAYNERDEIVAVKLCSIANRGQFKKRL